MATTLNQGATPATKTYGATEARAKFSDIFDEAYFGERVFVKKRERCVALVSVDFIETAERLIEMQAEIEAEHAKLALEKFQSEGGKTMEQIKAELMKD